MSFISSYKHLEKLCGEVMNDRRCIPAYIEEMERTPRGAFYVPSWNDDLKTLKHYRWVRNQIAHDPDCDEDNMCDEDDVLWLDQFYTRIMNQTDPLALYRKATAPRPAAPKKPVQTPPPSYTYHEPTPATAMRHKIKDVVSELNQYLLNGTKDCHVPIELQRAVLKILSILKQKERRAFSTESS